MASWKAEGLTYTHTTLASADTVALDDSLIRGLRYLLAVELAPEYGKSVTPEVARGAAKGWDAIVHAYTTVTDLKSPSELVNLPSQYGTFYSS